MFSRLAQLTLLALGFVISTQANAAPLAYGTYYDEAAFAASCTSSDSICRLNFSQTPADKLLLVQKINCAISSTQPIMQAFLEISTTFGGTALSRVLPIAVPPSQLLGGQYRTNFREDTQFLVGNGRFPFLVAFASAVTTSSINCTIMGELVTPIQ